MFGVNNIKNYKDHSFCYWEQQSPLVVTRHKKPQPYITLLLCVVFPLSSVMLHHHPGFFGRHTPRSQGLSYSPLGFSSRNTIVKLSTSHPWAKSSYPVQYPAPLWEERTHYTHTRDTSDPTRGHKPQNRTQVCTNIQSETFWDCCQ